MVGMALFKKKLTKEEELNKTEKPSFSWGFFDALNLYTRIIADWVTKGRADNPSDKLGEGRVLGDNQFYYSVNRIFTKERIKKPYFIELPMYMDRGFVTDLREDISRRVNSFNQANRLEEHVTVTSIIDANNFKVDLSQGRMQGRFRVWARNYEKLSREAENKRIEDELKSDKHTLETKHKVGSYLYMKEAVEEEKASFFKTTLIIELEATSDEILEEADKVLKAFVFQNKMQYKEVFIQTNEYMRSYTPVTNRKNSLIQDMNEGTVFADDTLGSLSVTTHGVIGDETGVYHGVDVLSRRVVTFDMYRGSDAKNILLTARTGEGKSGYAKMLYTFYSMENKYSTVVFDYEGSEYRPLGNIINTTNISLSSTSGKFVNTMVIGDLTGDPDIDSKLKIDAQDATIRIFNLLVDEFEGMQPEEEAILSKAMQEVYLDFNVTENPNSWKNSKGITFFHIYLKIKDYLYGDKQQHQREFFGEDKIKQFIIILSPYFEEGGTHKHWFQESISIQEILDSQHIIFSFDMGGQEESMVNGKLLALKQLFASHITTLKANYNHKHNKKTVVFIEEMQRYLKQRYSGEIIAKFTSGGRKNGLITYLITNSPTELLNMTDNANDNVRDNASTIMGNITMYLIGALLKQDMEGLIRAFNLDNSRGVLEQLTEIAQGSVNNSGLKYCFYVQYKGQSGIVRMLSHPDLEDLPLYKTIDMKEEDTDNISKHDDHGLRTVKHMNKEDLERGIDRADEMDKKKKSEEASFTEYMDTNRQDRGIWNERVDIDTNKRARHKNVVDYNDYDNL